MRKFICILFASLLVLGACSNDSSNKDDSGKSSETKSKNNPEKKSGNKDKSDDKKTKDNKEKSANKINKESSLTTKEQSEENQNDNEQNFQNNASNEQSQNTQNIQVINIKDRNTLESIIYGNYSEEAKIQAYKSAVANGVIPQGNVMEGPASAAYKSSLRVESGQEKSVYNRTADDWVKGQEEWVKASPAEKEQIRKNIAKKYGYKYNPSNYDN
ncbi:MULTISPECIES: hypothetical protein [Staphylococcus]|jgi:hypothetical protein|uniref:hypothetical protein n=1 Tax=Staphylococcus TaxID=1279 RepID=UPI0004598685|nr:MULTISPECIES: hypothetical protein [Staphylococcus]AMG62775.1 hypothetical protein AL501_00360 [Staphylococcus lugdunensis]KAK56868.1 putative lipoprotein [Staphylococcus lugdunensis VCU150]MCI2814238.1 hypothetical protein [Staphylococcus lugdunensis]MCI2844317.1 hypothetical protein [Staphylococcus lugdunensis]MDU0967458.1 hypothetical protein [Staphylococcus lugdunensis]